MCGTIDRQWWSIDDVAAVGLHAGRVEPEALGVGHRADGQQRVASPRPTRPSSQLHGHPAVVDVDPDGPGALEQPHAAVEEVVLERGGDLGVLLRAAPAGG